MGEPLTAEDVLAGPALRFSVREFLHLIARGEKDQTLRRPDSVERLRTGRVLGLLDVAGRPFGYGIVTLVRPVIVAADCLRDGPTGQEATLERESRRLRDFAWRDGFRGSDPWGELVRFLGGMYGLPVELRCVRWTGFQRVRELAGSPQGGLFTDLPYSFED